MKAGEVATGDGIVSQGIGVMQRRNSKRPTGTKLADVTLHLDDGTSHDQLERFRELLLSVM
jgi:hypothetical protein